MHENHRIIFHIPWKIRKDRHSASQLRPQKMLQAFRQCGYTVDTVMGSEDEKRESIRKIKSNIKSGMVYAFCYSESSTGPTLIANKWKQILKNRNQDFRFFKFLKKQGIQIGLFYRDIYWRFYNKNNKTSRIRKSAMKALYFFDLYNYKKYINTLFLPSIRMQKYIPLYRGNFKALPPGMEIQKTAGNRQKEAFPLTLFYVGGVSGHYNIKELLNYLCNAPQEIRCILCSREEEWNTLMADFPNAQHLKPPAVQAVHTSGEELNNLYTKANAALIFVEPLEYWDFAIPFKLFEYIGYGLPIVASEGTAVADFVQENDIGWVIPYSSDSLEELMEHLLRNPEEIKAKRQNILDLQPQHTWKARAGSVGAQLMLQ